ncbi:hypothetical protein MWN33_07675 [Starkeya koreensis]|uniref:Uncharacterized protein n=1 Tax=Ancylobacter koreensis TaxID=266121 RepID=A0ABT0DKV0_9HYPH|nr:hypothetical protein [Ancylobacter koreensis]MCK0207911.1 hypothetical protein [Ancylobacter koreensis]
MSANEGRRRLDRASLPPLALLRYEKALAETLHGFLAELCLTNAGVVMAYLSGQQDGNIDDLIASSAELFLKPGQFHYARRAVIDSDWGLPPLVSIAMSFRRPELTAEFHIVFDADAIGVHIDSIDFAAVPTAGEAEDLSRFEAALAAARLSAH